AVFRREICKPACPNRDSSCAAHRDVDDARRRSTQPGSRKVTQTAKGLRQFAVARQQTQVEQVIARQAWRVEPRSRATLRHSQRAAGQQLESEEKVARVGWGTVAPGRSWSNLWYWWPG